LKTLPRDRIVIFIAVFIYFLHLARETDFCATDLR